VQGNLHAPFGKRTTEKDLHHRHLAGALLHSEGAGAQQCAPATRRFRIQRRRKRGTTKRAVYTYPSKKALASIVGRVRTLTLRSSHPTLAALLRQLNPVLRGWCTYFRHGVSKATFGYLDQYTWHRVVRWIRKRHNKTKWDVLYRRYLQDWRPVEDGVVLFQPQTVTVSRYRYRAANIPTPWPTRSSGTAA
jgi:RNA-directed DNA polymerase